MTNNSLKVCKRDFIQIGKIILLPLMYMFAFFRITSHRANDSIGLNPFHILRILFDKTNTVGSMDVTFALIHYKQHVKTINSKVNNRISKRTEIVYTAWILYYELIDINIGKLP